jgi:GH25 family lysozyme M1 (1,4-beta-N-acetylmuramidase)
MPIKVTGWRINGSDKIFDTQAEAASAEAKLDIDRMLGKCIVGYEWKADWNELRDNREALIAALQSWNGD